VELLSGETRDMHRAIELEEKLKAIDEDQQRVEPDRIHS
jgi:hypothetical protein